MSITREFTQFINWNFLIHKNIDYLAQQRPKNTFVLFHEHSLSNDKYQLSKLRTLTGFSSEGLIKLLKVPSKTVDIKNINDIEKSNSENLLNNFKQQLTSNEITYCQSILDCFQINLYRAGEPMPVKDAIPN